MYNDSESKQYETAWLEAERDLLINGYISPPCIQDAQENPIEPPEITENDSKDNSELTRDGFIRTLEKVSRPLDKGKF